MNRIDLHMHSNHSDDADYTPSHLIKMCHDAGLEVVALADHNCVTGVNEMIEAGQERHIKVIPAIEIDCFYNEVGLHILGYNIDINDPRFNQLGEAIKKQEQTASPKRVKLVEAMGIYVNHDKLKPLIQDGVINGEALGEASIYEPENEDNEYIKPFLKGGSLSDNPFVNFYWEYCAQGKPAYVPIEYPSLKDVVALIKEAGGVAVFAHPGNNIKEDEQLLYEIMSHGLVGLEAYSSYHDHRQETFYIKHAEKNGWLITCGSDFHGKNKPSIRHGDIDIDAHHEARLFEYFKG